MSRRSRPSDRSEVELYRDAGKRTSLRRPQGVHPYAANSTVRARPALENIGFRVVDERTYHLTSPVKGSARIGSVSRHDGRNTSGEPIALDPRREPLEACFLAVMNRAAENDGYNALVLTAGLPWRDVAVIRTISRFLAPDPRALFAGLHVGDAAQARAHRSRHRRAVPGAVRPAPGAERTERGAARGTLPSDRNGPAGRSTASTRTASCVISSMR